MLLTDLIEPLLTATSGSVGDVTHGRNQFGPWTRPRQTPADPNTSLQAAMRAAMAGLTDRWATLLNPEQQASWTVYATHVPLVGRLGRRNYVGGLPHYLRSNLARSQVTTPPLSIVDHAPQAFDLGPFTPITHAVCNLVDETIVLFIDNSDDWAAEIGSGFLIWLSAVKPTTIHFYKSPYRFFTIVRGNPSPLPATVQTFPMPASADPDEHYFLKGRITRNDGRLSHAFRLDVAPDPQLPAEPVSLDRVVPFPPQYDLTFNDLIANEPHASMPWALRADETIWNVLSVTTVAHKLRLRVTAAAATDLPDRVLYDPVDSDVRGVSTSIAVPSFVFFPK